MTLSPSEILVEGAMRISVPPSLRRPLIVVATLPFFLIVFFLLLDVLSIGPKRSTTVDSNISMDSAVSMVPVAGRATLGSAVNVPGTTLDQHEIAHMRYMREEEKLARDVGIVPAAVANLRWVSLP